VLNANSNGYATVAGGDFNLRPRTGSGATYSMASYYGPYIEGDQAYYAQGTDRPTAPNPGRTYKIDYLWGANLWLDNASTETIRCGTPSDHCAITTYYEWAT